MSEKTKSPTRNKKQAIVSIILIAAILITGAFAFLTATDSKTNVFTVGNVDIEFHEIFNNVDYGKNEDPGAQGIKINNIVPGQSIQKAPYIVNSGNNPAYTFIAVGIPTDTSTNVYNGQGTYTAKSELDIKVKAYAIQQQYNGATNADETWTNYFKNDMISGTASDAGIELFTLNNGTSAVTTGTHTIGSDWQEFSTPYSVNDGGNTYTYHFFKYVANNELLPVGTTTAHLFDKVVFNENIGGDTPPEPVTINYLLPEDDTDTLAGTVNLAATSDIPEGYRLVESKTVMPGESIGDVYFDTSMDKSTENKTGDYIDAETGEVIYSNLKLYKDTNALYTYSDAGYENIVPQKYLCFDMKDKAFLGVHSSYWDEVNTNNKPCTVIIPSSLDCSSAEVLGDTLAASEPDKLEVFTKTSIGYLKHWSDNLKTDGYKKNITSVNIRKWYIIDDPNNLYDAERTPEYDSEDWSNGGFGENPQTYKYTLKEKYQNIKMSFVIPGTVTWTQLGDARLDFISPNVFGRAEGSASGTYTDVHFWYPMKDIYFGTGTQDVTCHTLVETVTLPNTVTNISRLSTKQTELVLPNSVTKIGRQAFSSCPNLKKITLPISLEQIGNQPIFGNVEFIYNGNIDSFKPLVKDLLGHGYDNAKCVKTLTSYSNRVICDDGFIKDGYSHYTSEDISTHLNETVKSFGLSHFSCDCGYSYDANTHF